MPVAYHEGHFPPAMLDLGALFPLVGRFAWHDKTGVELGVVPH